MQKQSVIWEQDYKTWSMGLSSFSSMTGQILVLIQNLAKEILEIGLRLNSILTLGPCFDLAET